MQATLDRCGLQRPAGSPLQWGMRVRWIVLAVLVALATGAAVFAGSGALSADRRPGRLEAAVAPQLVRLSIPRDARAARNPLAPSDDWHPAASRFAGQCGVCHGDDGRGHTAIGAHVYPPVPDLTSGTVQHFSDGELFAIIRHGVSWTAMPAFASTQSDADTWRLVSFIRHLPELPADEPHAHDQGAPAGPAQARTVKILIDGTSFEPRDTTVSVGDTVEWTNNDPFPHNVTSEAGHFRSGDLAPGDSWQFRPATTGTFTYECTLHPGMSAVLHVR